MSTDNNRRRRRTQQKDKNNNSGASHCSCGLLPKTTTASRPHDYGRRFLECPNEDNNKCTYLQWLDPPWDWKAKRTIIYLLGDKSRLQDSVDCLQQLASDMPHLEHLCCCRRPCYCSCHGITLPATRPREDLIWPHDNLEYDDFMCKCRGDVKVNTCWNYDNAGRSYIECGREDEREKCNYMSWIDAEWDATEKNIINTLLHEMDSLYSDEIALQQFITFCCCRDDSTCSCNCHHHV